MRVAVDARIRSGETGGIEGVVIGLARGLADLDDDGSEYLFLGIPGASDFLLPYLGLNSRLVYPRSRSRVTRALVRTARAVRSSPAARKSPPASSNLQGAVPDSDGTVERVEADLVHFTFQAGFRTSIPSIYHPHDLQHLHLPAFFSPELIDWRENCYRTMCAQASMVAVASDWTKQDVISQYGLEPERVRVVPLAPPTSAYRDLDPSRAAEMRAQLGVPDRFVLYPAQTWEHKNHVRLLRALATLRDQHGLIVPLVAAGKQNDNFGRIQREQSTLGLDDQVTWPGFVSEAELQALYMGATAVVIPTRFEAGSFPLWEAFQAGVAAACSNVTSLPEQAGDAALLFDPDDVDGMGRAVHRLWTDDTLRDELVTRGRARVSQFTWSRTARLFRAHYRRLTGSQVTDEDQRAMDTESSRSMESA